ncbi:MAG: TolC family protein [Spirochaetaceae bacterium]|nr:MAG: TolC family protein [Spirochaetaceae bacterium]
MRIRFLLLVGAVLLTAGAVAFGEPTLSGGEPLSLRDAVDLALGFAPVLRDARLARDAAQLSFAIARAEVTPSLRLEPDGAQTIGVARDRTGPSFDAPLGRQRTSLTMGTSLLLQQALPTGATLTARAGSSTRIIAVGDDDPVVLQAPSASVSIAQPVFVNRRLIDGRVYAAALEEAELGRHDAEVRLRDAENDTVIRVVQAYLGARTATDAHIVSALAVDRARAALRVVEARHEAGLIRFDEVLDAELAVAQAVDTWYAAEIDRDGAYDALRALIGPFDLGIDTFILSQQPGRAVDAATDGPDPADVERARIALRRAQIAAIVAGVTDGGTLTLALSVNPRYAANRQPGSDFAASVTDLFDPDAGVDVSVALRLSVPLVDGGAARLRAERREIDMARSQLTLADRRDANAATVERLARQLGLAERSADRAREQLDQAHGRLERVLSLERAGEATAADVDTADAERDRRAIALRAADAEVLVSSLRLAAARGARVYDAISRAAE